MGWLGNLFIWFGLYRVGSKQRSAFVWTIIGEAIWVGYATYHGWYDLAISCVVFIALAAHNWRQWGKQQESDSDLHSLPIVAEALRTTDRRHPGHYSI